MDGRFLVVDDVQDDCDVLAMVLRREGAHVVATTSVEEAFEHLARESFDVVLTDFRMDALGGVEVCRRVAEISPGVPVVVVTGAGSMDAAVDAMRAGAYDFVTKPIDAVLLAITVARALQHRRAHVEVQRLREAMKGSPARGMVGSSSAMKRIQKTIDRVAGSDASVLIRGETGVGKELAARRIHAASRMSHGPFVAINCAAMPPALLESELFGYVRGAFTDAKTDCTGLFVQAHKGTLFLDEIGEMPLELQPKLLRALQERCVRPVGGDTEIAFDTRIVAASNRDLEEEVAQKRFREDLYYRINVVEVALPPLRDRDADVLELAQYFLQQHANSSNTPVHGLSPQVAEALMAYTWPGNVRELENCMARAVAFARYDELMVDDLHEKVRASRQDQIRGDGQRHHGDRDAPRPRAALHRAGALALRRQRLADGAGARHRPANALPHDGLLARGSRERERFGRLIDERAARRRLTRGSRRATRSIRRRSLRPRSRPRRHARGAAGGVMRRVEGGTAPWRRPRRRRSCGPMRGRRLLAFAASSFVLAACGARTPLFVDAQPADAAPRPARDAGLDARDASAIDAPVADAPTPPVDAPMLVDAPLTTDATASCDGGITAYLLDNASNLYTFDPATLAATLLGPVSCPASAGPWTLSVSREGYALVIYEDWNIYRVDLTTLACTTTAFVPTQLGFDVQGEEAIAISRNPNTPEQLFVYGMSNAVLTLAVADPAALVLSEVGPLTPDPGVFPADMQGNAQGELFVLSNAGPLLEVDSSNANVLVDDQTSFDASTWAIMTYGSQLYFFGDGTVYQEDIATQALTTLGNVGVQVVGASAAPCVE